VLHGLFLIVHKMFQGFCASRPFLERALRSPPGMLLRLALTFFSVCLGWVFFRATTLTTAATFLHSMASVSPLAAEGPLPNRDIYLTIAVVIVCYLVRRFELWPKYYVRLPASLLGLSYATAVTLALFLAPSGTKPFIYFQF